MLAFRSTIRISITRLKPCNGTPASKIAQTINYKNLDYEIETNLESVSIPLGDLFTINYKNLDYEIGEN